MKSISKVWGREDVIINTKKYAGKFLFLKKGYQCSLHYHKIKDETFYVLSGEVFLEYGKKSRLMKKGETQRIKPKVRHRFTGKKNSVIIEVSTRDFKEDSYRLTKSQKI